MIVKLLTEHHLEFLSLKEGSRGSYESTLINCQIVGNLMPWLTGICHVVYQQSLIRYTVLIAGKSILT